MKRIEQFKHVTKKYLFLKRRIVSASMIYISFILEITKSKGIRGINLEINSPRSRNARRQSTRDSKKLQEALIKKQICRELCTCYWNTVNLRLVSVEDWERLTWVNTSLCASLLLWWCCFTILDLCLDQRQLHLC